LGPEGTNMNNDDYSTIIHLLTEISKDIKSITEEKLADDMPEDAKKFYTDPSGICSFSNKDANKAWKSAQELQKLKKEEV